MYRIFTFCKLRVDEGALVWIFYFIVEILSFLMKKKVIVVSSENKNKLLKIDTSN